MPFKCYVHEMLAEMLMHHLQMLHICGVSKSMSRVDYCFKEFQHDCVLEGESLAQLLDEREERMLTGVLKSLT